MSLLARLSTRCTSLTDRQPRVAVLSQYQQIWMSADSVGARGPGGCAAANGAGRGASHVLCAACKCGFVSEINRSICRFKCQCCPMSALQHGWLIWHCRVCCRAPGERGHRVADSHNRVQPPNIRSRRDCWQREHAYAAQHCQGCPAGRLESTMFLVDVELQG